MKTENLLIYSLLTIMAFRGYRRGFSGEIGGLLGLVLAIVVGHFSLEPLGKLAANYGWFGANAQFDRLGGYALALVLGLAIWLLAGSVFKNILSYTLNRTLDTVLGGITGAAKGLILIALARHWLKL